MRTFPSNSRTARRTWTVRGSWGGTSIRAGSVTRTGFSSNVTVTARGFSAVRLRHVRRAIRPRSPRPGSRTSAASAFALGRLTHCRTRPTSFPRASRATATSSCGAGSHPRSTCARKGSRSSATRLPSRRRSTRSTPAAAMSWTFTIPKTSPTNSEANEIMGLQRILQATTPRGTRGASQRGIMKKPARLILANFLLAGLSAAQTPAQAPRVTASAELTLFNLDVVVTTPAGDAVHGLKAEDFEVRHGGKTDQADELPRGARDGLPRRQRRPDPDGRHPRGGGAPRPLRRAPAEEADRPLHRPPPDPRAGPAPRALRFPPAPPLGEPRGGRRGDDRRLGALDPDGPAVHEPPRRARGDPRADRERQRPHGLREGGHRGAPPGRRLVPDARGRPPHRDGHRAASSPPRSSTRSRPSSR